MDSSGGGAESQQQRPSETRPTGTVRVVSIEMAKRETQHAVDEQLPQLAVSVGAQAVQQSVGQVTNATLRTAAEHCINLCIRQELSNAMTMVADIAEKATHEAVRFLLSPFAEEMMRTVFETTATDCSHEALAKLAMQGGQQAEQQLQKCVNDAVLSSYVEAVAVMSQFALKEAVEPLLRATLETALQNSMSELNRRTMVVVRSPGLRPPILQLTQQAVQRVANTATSQAMTRCLNMGRPITVPMLKVGVVPPAAPSGLLQAEAGAPPQGPPPSAVFPQVCPPTVSSPAGRPPTASPPPGQPDAFLQDLVATLQGGTAAPRKPPGPPPPGIPISLAMGLAPPPAPAAASPVLAAEPDNLVHTSMFLPDPETGMWREEKITLPRSSFTCLDQSSSKIETLPDDVLLRVLSYVEPLQLTRTCANVSKRWRRLCMHPQLWRHRVLYYSLRTKNIFSQVLDSAPVLAMVDCEKMSRPHARRFGSGPNVPPQVRQALLMTRCLVRGLRLVTFDLQPTFVMAVLQHLKDRLVELDLTVSEALLRYRDGAEDQGPSVLLLIQTMPELRKLRLAGTFDCEFEFSEERSRRHSLKELDLQKLESASEVTASSLILAHSATLSTVKLSDRATPMCLTLLSLCSHLTNMTVPCEVLRNFIPQLPSLVNLTLTQNRSLALLGPATRMTATSFMPNLKILVLDGVTEYVAIPECVELCFPGIKSVSFKRTHLLDHFLPLIKSMPCLEALTFDEETRITTQVFQGLHDAAPGLQNISVLRSLRCAGGTCWKPIHNYLKYYFPTATLRVDLPCTCSSPL